MYNRIKNALLVVCEGVDLTTVSNIEFYVKQPPLSFCYIPEVISSEEMLVVVPFEDAMKLKPGEVKVQFAYTDAAGNPRPSPTEIVPVDELQKEAGYDPI